MASPGLTPRRGVYSCELYSQGHRVWGLELDPTAAAFIPNLRDIQCKRNMLQTDMAYEGRNITLKRCS